MVTITQVVDLAQVRSTLYMEMYVLYVRLPFSNLHASMISDFARSYDSKPTGEREDLMTPLIEQEPLDPWNYCTLYFVVLIMQLSRPQQGI
jgi:hypothetical protein